MSGSRLLVKTILYGNRYYFAVVECDTVQTASKLYDELEGVDCEFAVDGLDIRFIPEDMPPFTSTYPRPPRCEATGMPPKGYQPPAAFVSALRHSKVKCTWDETPAPRTRRLRKLASSSDDDDLSTAPENITVEDIELPAGLTRTTAATGDQDEENKVPDDIDAYRRLLLGDLADDIESDDDRKADRKADRKVDRKEDREADREEEKKRTKEKLRALQQKQKDDDGEEVEFSWTVGGGDATTGSHDDDQHNVQHVGRADNGKSPWETYLEKRKLKKKQQKLGRKQRDTEDQDDVGLNKKKKKTKAFPLIGVGHQSNQDDEEEAENKSAQRADLEILALGEDASSSEDDDDGKLRKKKNKKKVRDGFTLLTKISAVYFR